MIESRCGTCCSVCKWKESTGCTGCVSMEKAFWGDCLVKTCCESKSFNHCGECPDFPCETLHAYAYEEEHGDNGLRIEQCKKWKEECRHE